MSHLLRLGAALLIAASAIAQETNSHFEVDIIFPRNETYTTSEAFPFALAIQNITAVLSLGAWVINWAIMPLEDGSINRGASRDSGVMIRNDTVDMGDYALLVDYTDVTQWIDRKKTGDVYALKWNLDWPDLSHECGWVRSPVGGEIQFSVEAPREQERSGLGIEPDVASAGECPVLSTVVEIRPSPANETCPDILSDEKTVIEGTPCDVVVDDELAESITSEVERLIGPTEVPNEGSTDDEDDEDGAGSLKPPAGAALAAACALGYFAFTSL